MSMYTINANDKLKSLISQLRSREREIFGYQVNIDNYIVAITLSEGEFKARMEASLAEEKKQQGIVQIMLDAVLIQLEGENIAELLEKFNE